MKRAPAAVSALLLTSGLLACVVTPAHAAPPTSPSPDASAVARAATVLRTNPGAVRVRAPSPTRCTAPLWIPAAPPTPATPATYQGLRVYGGDFVIHTAPNGTYAGSSVGWPRR